MHKLTTIVSFLFLSSLVIFTGLFLMFVPIGFALVSQNSALSTTTATPTATTTTTTNSNANTGTGIQPQIFVTVSDDDRRPTNGESLIVDATVDAAGMVNADEITVDWRAWDASSGTTVEYFTQYFKNASCTGTPHSESQGTTHSGRMKPNTATTYSWHTKAHAFDGSRFSDWSLYNTCYTMVIDLDISNPPPMISVATTTTSTNQNTNTNTTASTSTSTEITNTNNTINTNTAPTTNTNTAPITTISDSNVNSNTPTVVNSDTNTRSTNTDVAEATNSNSNNNTNSVSDERSPETSVTDPATEDSMGHIEPETSGRDDTTQEPTPEPATHESGTPGTILYSTPTRISTAQKTILSDRTREYCASQSIVDPLQCQKLIDLKLDPECRVANLHTITECDRFLKQRHLNELCVQNSITTEEACDSFLLNTYRRELYCGSIDESLCIKTTQDSLLGTINVQTRKRDIVKKVIAEQADPHITTEALTQEVQKVEAESETPLSSDDITPFVATNNRLLLLIESDQTVDVSSQIDARATIPFVVTVDDDRDGLSNDLEALFGSDPNNSDSDSDGYLDGEEVANGYDPLLGNNARLTRIVSPVEKALLGNNAIEQPIAKGSTDGTFITNPVSKTEQKEVLLSGDAEPNSVVLLYIYSQLPLVLAVETDASGKWSYTLSDPLSDGSHTVYVALTDATGKITKKSNPLSFFISEAQAVTIPDLVETEPLVFAEQSISYTNYYLLGGFILIIIALIIILLIMRSRKKNYV